MPEPANLSPPNATRLMRALSRVSAERRPIAAPLGSIWDPATCPPEVLAYLAAQVGVAIWDPTWPDTRKRSTIAQTIALTRRRGTVPAFEAFLAFADASVFDFRAPPQTLIPRPARTVAERAAWAAQFPELRVYPFRNRHVRPQALFPGRPWDGRAPTASEAPSFAGSRAVVIDGGIETPVPVRVVTSSADFAAGYSQVALPTRARRFLVGGVLAAPNAIPRPSTAGSRLFSFRDGASQPDTLIPGQTPLDAAPTRTAQTAVRRTVLATCHPWFGRRRFADPSPAGDRVFDSFRLYDPARVASGTLRPKGGWVLGRSILGQPPFEIDIAVDLARKRTGRALFPKRYGIVRDHDPKPMQNVLSAVRAAKLGRDQVLIRTGIYRPVRLGDPLKANGTFKVGQVIRSL